MASEPCRYQPPKIVSVNVKVFDKCDEKGIPVHKMQSISVLDGTQSDAVLRYEKMFEIEGDQKCNLAIAAVPEWWQVRTGQRPQLVILYAEVSKDGKLTSSRWSLNLPHYNKPKSYKPAFPTYEKGSFEGILRLSDNSPVIVNCKNSTECKRVLNALKQFIPQKLTKGSVMKIGERFGADYKQVRVKAVSIKFFAEGQKDMKPTWIMDLRK
jgi:hypothetical protein